MTPADLLAALRLPPDAVLERRVAKADLADQLARPADRRLVAERVESLHWHAALNPANAGLAAEGTPGLAVVTLVTRGDPARPAPRLVNLVHRAVPDPLLLVTARGADVTTLSVKPAVGDVLVAGVPPTLPRPAEPLLAVNRASSLSDLRRRWADAVLGLIALKATGRFPGGGGDPRGWGLRRTALDRLVALDAEVRKLAAAARRERQAGRLAELNARLQAARRDRDAAADFLSDEPRHDVA